MKTSRQTAFDILEKIRRDNSYSNIALDAEFEDSELSQKDKAFAAAIVYGVIERMITLDYQLARYLSQPLSNLKPKVRTAMRIGAYQLLFMDRVPSSAAVNESVKLVKNNKVGFASGLVNAVMRKVDSNGLVLPDSKSEEYLSVKYSCPKWLCKLWEKSYGYDNAEKLLETSLGNVPAVLKVNTLKTSTEELINALSSEKIEAEICKETENAVTVNNSSKLFKSKSYINGLFHVQDTSSQLCCKALAAKNGDIVFDICSAPGGKACTIAEMMNDDGKIYAFDIYEQRLNLIKQTAQRLGINSIKTLINDGTYYNKKLPLADKILCDVPCSGLGVIRKKPEIRYKDSGEVDKLPKLQYSILCISAKYVKSGGTLIYSTCSLNPKENEDVVNRFIRENKEFKCVKVLPDVKRYGDDTDYITLMPHIHNCDGFFIAKLIKV